MKSLLNVPSYSKALLFLFLCLTSLHLGASTIKPQVSLQKHGEKALIVSLDFDQKRNFKVSLKDGDRVLLWRAEQSEMKHFAKKINLKNLPDGTYDLEIEDQFMITIYQMTIENNILTLEEEKPKWVFKPILVQKEDKVHFSLFQGQAKEAEITILDSEYNIVYQERCQEQQKIERSFDFSQVGAHDFVLQTKVNGRFFEQEINW